MWIQALSYVVTVIGQTSCRPSPEHAGVEPEALPDAPLPLVHEVAERRDDEGRDACGGRRWPERDLGLSGAGRLDDHAATARALPRLNGRLLVGPERRQRGPRSGGRSKKRSAVSSSESE